MKKPIDWIEVDLEDLINTQRKESIDLEYKGSRALMNDDNHKNEISKDVSAFANSAGGIIIYGICENGHIPTKIEGIDLTKFSKEWLEQVISSNIQRKIDGIKINQIDLTKGNAGKVAYVVCIPQSNRAPHQANDKKFYKRYNFESKAMEEYEVRDVSHRNETPLLKLTTDNLNKKIEINFDSSDSEGKYTGFDLGFSLTNESIEPAHYAVVRISIDSRLKFLHSNIIQRSCKLTINGNNIDALMFEYTHGNTNQMPVFDGLNFNFSDTRIIIREKYGETAYFIHWEIHSPKMNKQTKLYALGVFQTNDKWYAKLVRRSG